VPLRSKSIDAISTNGFIAGATLGRIKSIKVSLAVRSAISLIEVASAKGLQALCANKVVCVPLLSEGSNATIENWFLAVSTLWTIDLLEAFLAVRNSILFKEVPGAKRLSAVATAKVLWMIGFS
jgi:hypothetical protein